MYCLSCGKNGLSLDTEICPRCNAHLPSLNRDLLSPGRLLDRGKYRIEYPLGRGGFGVTYRAIHTQLDRPVAIKEFYPKEQAYRDETTTGLIVPEDKEKIFKKGIDRFLKEAKILSYIEHPNIVKVRDYFSENNTAYIVMNLVSGKTLASLINERRNKRLPEARVKQIVSKLVDALETIHAASIYHLDIKPENILITEDNKIVLIDFGASKQGLGNKSTRSFTLSYAPPELISGKSIGPFSDIFELGVTIYEMLTGNNPPNSVDRLVEDIWQPLDLQQPWRYLVESALKLSEKERPSRVREWWESAFSEVNIEAKTPTTIQSISNETRNRSLIDSSEFSNQETILNVNQNPKNLMKRNLFKYATTMAGMALVLGVGPKILETARSPLLADNQKPLISQPATENPSPDLKSLDRSAPNKFNDARTYYERGNIYKDLHKWDLAIADYTKALEINPNDPHIYNNRGIVYRKLKQWDLALSDYTRAIEINPNYAKAYSNRGNIYKDLEGWDLALADYNKAIKINPKYAVAYNNRGILYRKMKQWDLALADYNKAISIDPYYVKAHNNRGNVHKDRKQWNLAIADYNKAISIDPDYAKAYQNRAEVWTILGELDKSKNDLQTAGQLLN